MIKFLDILREIGNIKDPNVPEETSSYEGNNVGKDYKFTINDKKIELSIVNNIVYSLELLDKIYNTNYSQQIDGDKPNKQSSDLKTYYEKNNKSGEYNRPVIINFFKKSTIFPKTSAIISFSSNGDWRGEKDKKDKKNTEIKDKYKKWQDSNDIIKKEGFSSYEEAFAEYLDKDGKYLTKEKGEILHHTKEELRWALNNIKFSLKQETKEYKEWEEKYKDTGLSLPKPKFEDQTKEYLEILSKLSGIIKNYVDKEKPDVVIVNYKMSGVGVSEETRIKRNKLYLYYMEKYKPSNYTVKTKDDVLYLEKDGK